MRACWMIIAMAALPCAATTIVAPNANTGVNGDSATNNLFLTSDFTFQWVLDVSQFSTVPSGSSFTGIGFRLETGQSTWPPSTDSFGSWTLELSQSLNGAGSLSSVFANNIGPDVTTVYSAPLSLTANEFTGGAGPNPFVLLPFSTPYSYTGGSLLMTVRYTAGSVSPEPMDGNTADSNGEGVGGTGSSATSGTTGVNYPITEFQFTASSIPEPSTLLLCGLAALVFTASARRRS